MAKKGLGQLEENIIQLLQKKKFIILNTVIIAVFSIIISLLLPKKYSSQASIISSGGGTSNFLSMLSGIPVSDFGLSALSEDISNYIAILESRAVKEKIVNEFNLIERYDSKDVEFAIGGLDKHVELKVTEEGNLLITTLDKDPVIARDMANAFIRELDEVNKRLGREKGKNNREFLENRLNKNKIELVNAEDKLKRFQNQYGIIDVPNQVIATIETYSQLYAKKIENEISLKVAENSYSPNDPKLIQLKKIDIEFEKLLKQFVENGDSQNIMTAFKELPERGLEYARLFREVELQNKILAVILPQYEQAAMEESKNIPSLQVIDEPKIAINKAKPQRSLIVIASTLMAFLISTLYVLIEYRTKEFRSRIKHN